MVGNQDTANTGRPVTSGLQVLGEPGHYCTRTRPLWWPSRPAAFFLQNVLQLHQQRWVILRVDSLSVLKIINEEDAVLIPKNRGEKFSSVFSSLKFLRRGEPLSRHSIDCCVVSRSYWYNQVSSMVTNRTGNHLDVAEKFQNLLRRLAPLMFLIRIQTFLDHFA